MTPHGALPLLLDDGRHLVLRALSVDDEPALRRAFEAADPQVLRARFGGGIPPFATISTRLHQMDGVDRYAVAAFADDGDVIGVAEYVRTELDPSAEVAVVVARDWQRHGVGTALLRALAEHAIGAGITSATALISGSNQQVLDLVEELPVPHTVSYDHGSGDLRATLPEPA